MSEGFVYVARRADGIIKIGASRNPTRRIRAIAYRLGQRMTLVYHAACAEPFRVERALHLLHADYGTGAREWFDLPPDVLDRIGEMLEDADALAPIGTAALSRQRLNVPMHFNTTDERAERLKQMAAILESHGIEFEARGVTGLLNDIAEHLEPYLAARLRTHGCSESYIKAALSVLK